MAEVSEVIKPVIIAVSAAAVIAVPTVYTQLVVVGTRLEAVNLRVDTNKESLGKLDKVIDKLEALINETRNAYITISAENSSRVQLRSLEQAQFRVLQDQVRDMRERIVGLERAVSRSVTPQLN